MFKLKNVSIEKIKPNVNGADVRKVECDIIRLKHGAKVFSRDREVWNKYSSSLNSYVKHALTSARSRRDKLQSAKTKWIIKSTDRRYVTHLSVESSGGLRNAAREYQARLRAHRSALSSVSFSINKKIEPNRYDSETIALAGRRVLSPDTYTKSTTYTEFGQILKLKKAKRVKEIYTHKKPQTDELHFGVELEFSSPLSRADTALKLSELDVSQFIRLTTDGSVRPESSENGLEVNLLCPESRRHEIIDKVTACLRDLGGSVNVSCGMHLHVDARNIDRESTYHRLIAAQRILYAMQPESRRSGDHFRQFCQYQKTRDLRKARQGSRYVGVNASALDKYGTIELRMHAGTLDSEKVKNWVDLTRSIVLSDEPAPKRALTNVENFSKKFKLDAKLAAYVKARVAKFKNHAEVEGV